MHKCRVENGWRLGLSVSGPTQDGLIREAVNIRVSTPGQSPVRLFDSVQVRRFLIRQSICKPANVSHLFFQCTYNVLEQRPGPALIEAREAGMDVIIKEGMANGRALRHPKLLECAKKLECAPDALALGAILAQPFQPRVLSGAVTAEQLRSNLGALSVEQTLSTADGKASLQQLMEGCRMESEAYWKDRTDLKWN